MSQSKSPREAIARRGARRRRDGSARESRRRALSWWTEPGVLTFLGALVVAGVGVAMVVIAIGRRPVERATLGGLSMELVEARWVLDQMDHGENFQKPSTMMPGMPEWGKQRVSLEMTFRNVSDRRQVFDGSEFHLAPEIGEEVPPMGAVIGKTTIDPGQMLNTVVHFDFDTTRPHGRIRAAWYRAGGSAFFAIPEPAEHFHLRPRGGEVALPPDARLLLPIGNSDRGEGLFTGVYGCIACHGDPAVAGTATVGPHLGGIGLAGATRVPGVSGAQYIYESIIDPGRVIAPECQNGLACSEPTAMPEYASLVTLQDVADLLAYLLEQTADVREGATREPRRPE